MSDDARQARPEDIPQVVRLVGVMFAELGTATNPSWATRARDELSRRLWRDVGIFVANVGSDLAACAVGVLHESLPSPRRRTQRVGYIEWVITDPGCRRRHYGMAVTSALVDWLDDQGAAVIDVHSSAVAEPLYRRLGFTGDGPLALRRRS
ncbi:MAG: GNAT family N-acetyltransferase [Mycobacterium sp.]|nr:GNAT family N-acetyltransferase [Mycobacterium sp.]